MVVHLQKKKNFLLIEGFYQQLMSHHPVPFHCIVDLLVTVLVRHQ